MTLLDVLNVIFIIHNKILKFKTGGKDHSNLTKLVSHRPMVALSAVFQCTVNYKLVLMGD